MRARDMKKYQTYPSQEVVPVVGEGTRSFNLAIEGWAKAIELATADNAARFVRAEWEALADLTPRLGLTPALPCPGQALADALFDHQRATAAPARRLGEGWRDTAARLGDLDYVHAWALVYVLQHHARTAWRHDVTQAEWWTMKWRRETFEPRK